MKRIESVTRSPVYSHLSESLTGVSVIRAYKCSQRFLETAHRHIDKTCTFAYATTVAQRYGLADSDMFKFQLISFSIYCSVNYLNKMNQRNVFEIQQIYCICLYHYDLFPGSS